MILFSRGGRLKKKDTGEQVKSYIQCLADDVYQNAMPTVTARNT
jgi:hypothetical protein